MTTTATLPTMTTLISPGLPTVTAEVDQAVADFCAAAFAFCNRIVREVTAGLARLRAAFERAAEDLRRTFGLPPLADHLRRLLDRVHWTGIARRHAERPPTRGYWLRRCFCLACRERKELA